MSSNINVSHHHGGGGCDDPIAKAVAAAAELAMNGGLQYQSASAAVTEAVAAATATNVQLPSTIPSGQYSFAAPAVTPAMDLVSPEATATDGTTSATLAAAVLLANFPGRNLVPVQPSPVAMAAAISPLQQPQPEQLIPSDDKHSFPHFASTSSSSVSHGIVATDSDETNRAVDDGRQSRDDNPTLVDVNHSNKVEVDDDIGGGSEDADIDSGSRIARSRARNREHARKTRVRKKAQLESLQSKVKGLQAESKALRQSLEECSIASILVGLTSPTRDVKIQALVQKASEIENQDIFKIVGGKRKRFTTADSSSNSNGGEKAPAQPLTILVDGTPTVIGGEGTHINWKTGMYSNENGFQLKLTHEQLEALRRERNRCHAKMTRDRKKSFIATIGQTIEDLEENNGQMKTILKGVVQTHFNHQIGENGVSQSTVGLQLMTQPAPTAPVPSVVTIQTPIDSRAVDTGIQPNLSSLPAKKRICHGFSLTPQSMLS